MATPEGDGAQSGADGTQSGTGTATGTQTGTQNSNPGTGTQSGTGVTLTDLDVARQEAQSYQEKMKAADKRASDYEAQLKQLRDKDLPATEKLQRDYEAAVQQVETFRETNGKLALENAFLSDNTYEWQNPKRALQLIDRSGVEIGDDGAVKGLKEALKALATSDPYLLKAKTEDPPPPGGTVPGNNGSTGGATPDHKSLVGRFPALSTRVRRS
jgi:hypothetical protein